MAENLNPPRIAGPHFFLDLKTMHFGRNGGSNSTTEAAAVEISTAVEIVLGSAESEY